MTSQELMTLAADRIPVKIALMDNKKLGMIRQWQEIIYGGNYHSAHLPGPNWLKLVDAYGLQVEGALAEDEFALTPPMLRPLVFAAPESAVAQAWLPDVEPPERVEGALHARVAAARLAWQFPYSPKLRGRLARARVPALVVWGERDRLVPPAHARAYAEGLPEARLAIVPGAAHYPYLEAPQRFAQETGQFLRERYSPMR